MNEVAELVCTVLLCLSHSPAQFQVDPEIPDGHDRDRHQVSQIGIYVEKVN